MADSQTSPSLLPARDYAPFRAGPFQLALGVQPLEERHWIEMDDRFVIELAEKDLLLRTRHDDVFAVLPEAWHGATELLKIGRAHV